MIVVIIFLVAIVLIIFWMVSIYNRIIGLRNRREQSFADIDVQLKQRNDLIPQLVETVKGYTSHERNTLEKVVAARNAVAGAGSISEKIQADSQLSGALQGLRVTVEAYPELKANTNFMHLQGEIADIENKLAAARRFFNSATTEYNTSIETFPNNLIAGRYGFKRETMYDLGAERRVQMDEPPKFNFNS
jgi:LemA protein